MLQWLDRHYMKLTGFLVLLMLLNFIVLNVGSNLGLILVYVLLTAVHKRKEIRSYLQFSSTQEKTAGLIGFVVMVAVATSLIIYGLRWIAAMEMSVVLQYIWIIIVVVGLMAGYLYMMRWVKKKADTTRA
ncbi:hypothetical protein [Paenibacillus wulumuqiensis]|uniref:hypothetical protein n=1 Tax=Paenibacillus wulumuqiensis TaxID=1567107 RepID=UPI0006190912|nr:hypothetical protein [Paenibacillus wulumuqiensis]